MLLYYFSYITVSMKTCTKCGETKPLSEFANSKSTKDKHMYTCKECNRQISRAFRFTASGVYTQIKARMKFYGTKPVTISRKDFVEWYESRERKCAYCSISEEDVVKLDDAYNSLNERLTVDCVENDVGYVKGNMVLACRRCNNMKSDLLTFEQIRYIGQNFLKPLWEKQLGKKMV